MTGRDLIYKAAMVGSVSTEDADRIATAIEALGYVCVPKVPTETMIQAAWADALAEDASGVWESMIGVAENILTAEEIPK